MEVKLPFYNLLNMLLTGVVFLVCIIPLYPSELAELVLFEKNMTCDATQEVVLLTLFIAAAYEIGLILNRIGSVLAEPIFKSLKVIYFSSRYSDYAMASKDFSKLEILSREYALSRTSTVEFFLLSMWSVSISKFFLFSIYFAIALLFLFSCRKHSKKIYTILMDLNQGL